MPDFSNDLTGVLFKNDKKESDKHPDYKGSAEVGGAEFWLSAWINEKKDGTGKYMKLKFEAKETNGSWEAARTKLKKDEVHEVDEGEIDLDSIPF